MNPILERINNSRRSQTDRVAQFLMENFGLKYGSDADTTLIITDGDRLIATASRTAGVFKYFGILDEYKGMGLSTKLIDALRDDAFRQGIYHYFIYTSPDKADLFIGSGFTLVNMNEYACLLESGSTDISSHMEKLKIYLGQGEKRGAIVMNLNPMTLGHLYLITEAARRLNGKELLIFVVEEDRSVFPFEDRIGIVREAVKDIENVRVLPGGEYIISQATFPTYFLKRVDDDIIAYTTMDAEIFLRYFSKELDIAERFLGEEPLDNMTYIYNSTLQKILSEGGVKVRIIPRLEMDSEPVSASRVRKLLSEDKEEEAMKYLPSATIDYLRSEKGRKIIEKLKEQV